MPAPKRNGYDHRAYRRARQRLRAKNNICWICGKEIDTTLPAGNPGAWTADHETPISKGGSIMGPIKPAHHGCNSRRGNRPMDDYQPTRSSQPW